MKKQRFFGINPSESPIDQLDNASDIEADDRNKEYCFFGKSFERDLGYWRDRPILKFNFHYKYAIYLWALLQVWLSEWGAIQRKGMILLYAALIFSTLVHCVILFGYIQDWLSQQQK